MTHKTRRPNHQLPTLLHVAPSQSAFRPGRASRGFALPGQDWSRPEGANQVALPFHRHQGISSRATPALSASALLASNSSAWTNSWEGAGLSEPVNQSLTPRRGQAKGGSSGQSRVRGSSARPAFQFRKHPRVNEQDAGGRGPLQGISVSSEASASLGLSVLHRASLGRSGYSAALGRA